MPFLNPHSSLRVDNFSFPYSQPSPAPACPRWFTLAPVNSTHIYFPETIHHLHFVVYQPSPIWHVAPSWFVVLHDLHVLMETLPWLPAPEQHQHPWSGLPTQQGRTMSPHWPELLWIHRYAFVGKWEHILTVCWQRLTVLGEFWSSLTIATGGTLHWSERHPAYTLPHCIFPEQKPLTVNRGKRITQDLSGRFWQ